MPTAVEYDPENQQLPAVQSPASNPGPQQGFAGGLFLGGVFVLIIAVLIFGPAGLLGGLFHTLMGDESWGALACLPAVQMGDGSVKPGDGSVVPAVQMGDGSVKPGDGSVVPAVQMGDGSVKPGDGSVVPAVQMGDGSVKPADFGLFGGLALKLNAFRLSLGLDGFIVPPNPCQPPALTPFSAPASGEGGPSGPGPACTPAPGDGVCSACENTDLDSSACVCNMDGICGPQEGFNCGDCMPPDTSGGDTKGGGRRPTPCPVGRHCP